MICKHFGQLKFCSSFSIVPFGKILGLFLLDTEFQGKQLRVLVNLEKFLVSSQPHVESNVLPETSFIITQRTELEIYKTELCSVFIIGKKSMTLSYSSDLASHDLIFPSCFRTRHGKWCWNTVPNLRTKFELTGSQYMLCGRVILVQSYVEFNANISPVGCHPNLL